MSQWNKDPEAWAKKTLPEQLAALRTYYCTGPCGQSASVLGDRSALQAALMEAIKRTGEREASKQAFLIRRAAEGLLGYVLGCRQYNEPAWMDGLCQRLNDMSAALGDDDRVATRGDGLQIITAEGIGFVLGIIHEV